MRLRSVSDHFFSMLPGFAQRLKYRFKARLLLYEWQRSNFLAEIEIGTGFIEPPC